MKSHYLTITGAIVLALFSCKSEVSIQSDKAKMIHDNHSYAWPEEAKVVHLNLTLDVNFEDKKLNGSANYIIETSDDAKKIVFDTYDLEIINVSSKSEKLDFSIGEKNVILGSPLSISLPPNISELTIEYATTPGARALQWLDAEQTADKLSPFLFTQSQAILARTWLPCQDSPGIRYTYNANVSVPQGFLALMSAENPSEISDDGKYEFKMPQAIPSYLMALTVGKIAFKEIGPRTGVYAETSMLDKCHYEFSEMEDMLNSAEELYGPYAWGRYDVIVLPPSFPFGGMENPRLTFATPTIIAGDKSLTSLVAHELAHSWSGNLVTNSTWDDFWLNEGFTVYFEQRIMEAVYGREYSEMLALLSYEGLLEEIAEIDAKNPDDTKLKLELKGRDPDDGMNAIAYDKGYLFLRNIEEITGRNRFDEFLKNYFQDHAFEVMDTESFLTLLSAYLTEEEKQLAQVDQWIYRPGLPKKHPVIRSEKFVLVEEFMNSWLNGGSISQIDSSKWSTHEYLHFINSLPEDISLEKVNELDEHFNFTHSGNCEILAAWFIVTIRSGYDKANDSLESFLVNVGRRKFLTPTYKALIKKDPSKERAREIYSKARGNYHSVSKNTMDELLDWKS